MTGTQCKFNLYKELSEIVKNPEFLNSEEENVRRRENKNSHRQKHIHCV